MQPNRPHVLLLISTGWGVRSLLQTAAFEVLLRETKVAILAAPELVDEIHRRHPGIEVEPLPPFEPWAGRAGRIYLRRNAHFRRVGRTETRRIDDRRRLRSLRGRTALREILLRFEARLRASRHSVLELAAEYERAAISEYPHRQQLGELFARFEPDLVVSTVPHVPLEAPPTLLARELGIPTVGWVSSWDNPTSKNAYYVTFDHYLVWSERLGEQMRRLYPETAGRTVTAVGVPHFDWYRDPGMRMSREELCREVDLRPDRRYVLYGTATPFLAPSEHLVVARLAQDLRRLDSKLDLLVRLHPGDDGARFARTDWPDWVRFQVPGRLGGLQSFCPTFEENRAMVGAIVHADVVVNLASTLTLDAAAAGKPVVNVGFGLSDDSRRESTIRSYYSYEHYRTVIELGAARLATTPGELVTEVSRYLREPHLEAAARERLVELWCGTVDGGAGRRLGTELAARADRHRRTRP